MKIKLILLCIWMAVIASCNQDDGIQDHCADGMLNFDETSIDCGGSCKACPPPTCNDGIQNQNEHAIDCGGPCDACTGFFSGVVDFSNILIAEGTSGFILSSTVYSKTFSGNNCNKDFYSILFNPQRINSIAVTFKGLYSGNCAGPDSAQFHSLFTKGSKMYAEDETDDGVSITWYDTDGKAWKSTLGDQTGSTFQVNTSETLNPSSRHQKHRVQAAFNCSLFDASGNFIPLDNGNILLHFGSE